MNRTVGYAPVYALVLALLFATGNAATAPVPEPASRHSVLIAFCFQQLSCPTEEQRDLGNTPREFVAGPDGAYYGTTAYSNTILTGTFGNAPDAGGSVYRADPVTRTVRPLYQFTQGYYPASWLKLGSDGSIYGGYVHAQDGGFQWQSEGLFRLSSAGVFTIIHDETQHEGFSCNAPVQDSLGNWIGVTTNLHHTEEGANTIYEITPAGHFKILLTLGSGQTFGQYFNCPNYSPVLAGDGNLYGIINGNIDQSAFGAAYRLTPDGTVSIIHTFGPVGVGPRDPPSQPVTPLTVGPDGALYGVGQQPRLQEHGSGNFATFLYRMSLDGQVTYLGSFGWHGVIQDLGKLTRMPDGDFYERGMTFLPGRPFGEFLFRLSPAGFEHAAIDETPSTESGYSQLTRGFDNALYGSSVSDNESQPPGGKYGGGVIFRYVPPPVQ